MLEATGRSLQAMRGRWSWLIRGGFTGGAGASIRSRDGSSAGTAPRLEGGRHGSWYVRLELPAGLDGRRRRIRRGGYPSRKAAAAVLATLRARRPATPPDGC